MSRQSRSRQRRSSAAVVQTFKNRRKDRAESTKYERDDSSDQDDDDDYDRQKIRRASSSSSSSSSSSPSSASDDSNDSSDDSSDENPSQRTRRSSIAQAAASSSRRRGKNSSQQPTLSRQESEHKGSGKRRHGFSSRGHMFKDTSDSRGSKETEETANTANETRRKRPDDYRIEARLDRVRSKNGSLGSSSRDVLHRNDSSRSMQSSSLSMSSSSLLRTERSSSGFGDTDESFNHQRGMSSSSVGFGEDDWFLERQRARQEDSKRERMLGARKEARRSIFRYSGNELLDIHDPKHIDAAQLSRLVSLLRYNRGYPVQSNFTRFEFPRNVFLSKKYRKEAASLFSSILAESTKTIKRLGFSGCFFSEREIAMILEPCCFNENIQLTHLIFDGNDLSSDEQGVDSLVSWLRNENNSSTLQDLRLRDTRLTDVGLLSLIETIMESTELPLDILDVTGEQLFDPYIVREMIHDMENAGCQCAVLYDKPNKSSKSKRKNRR